MGTTCSTLASPLAGTGAKYELDPRSGASVVIDEARNGPPPQPSEAGAGECSVTSHGCTLMSLFHAGRGRRGSGNKVSPITTTRDLQLVLNSPGAMAQHRSVSAAGQQVRGNGGGL